MVPLSQLTGQCLLSLCPLLLFLLLEGVLVRRPAIPGAVDLSLI